MRSVCTRIESLRAHSQPSAHHHPPHVYRPGMDNKCLPSLSSCSAESLVQMVRTETAFSPLHCIPRFAAPWSAAPFGERETSPSADFSCGKASQARPIACEQAQSPHGGSSSFPRPGAIARHHRSGCSTPRTDSIEGLRDWRRARFMSLVGFRTSTARSHCVWSCSTSL